MVVPDLRRHLLCLEVGPGAPHQGELITGVSLHLVGGGVPVRDHILKAGEDQRIHSPYQPLVGDRPSLVSTNESIVYVYIIIYLINA